VQGKDSDDWSVIVDSYVMDLLKIRRMEMLSIVSNSLSLLKTRVELTIFSYRKHLKLYL
jgi:hypothetical protein